MADGSVTGDVRELRQMLADCEQYLKDGETPAQRIERERRDTEAVLNLLIREKRKNERLRAEVAAERERCAVTAEECSCECCCTPDEIAMAEYIASKIREPNAQASPGAVGDPVCDPSNEDKGNEDGEETGRRREELHSPDCKGPRAARRLGQGE